MNKGTGTVTGSESTVTESESTVTGSESPVEAPHALLGASSSHRWLNCTPSAREEEREPDRGSEYAREGSLAHAIAALKLKERLRWEGFASLAGDLDTEGEKAEIRELAAYHSGEMEEYTDAYVNYVMERYREALKGTPDARIRVETRLDYSGYVPEGFGTGDAVIISDGMVEVVDLKYGKGVKVSAVENPQMKLYALGCGTEWEADFIPERVRMTIFQPRVGNLSAWETTWSELREWGLYEVKPRAVLAWRGSGHRQAGDWCRFCKASGRCAALASKSLELVALGDAGTLTAEQMGREVLPRLGMVSAWMEAVKERSLADALAGAEIPGWKIVRGRSVRKITDADGLRRKLTGECGLTEAQIERPRELRTIGDLEKLVGRKRFAEVSEGFVTKPEGKPTLVAEEDRREAVSAGDDFRGLDI